jgi:prepilin-type processing-associated H-X9-DG protein
VFTDYNNHYSAFNGDLRQGCFGNNGAAHFAHITDGTSNTIALGEAVGGALHKTSANYGPWGMTGTHTCCHGRVVSGVSSNVITWTAANAQWYTINGVYNNDALGRQYAWGFASKHPGGAQFTLADGSVRFLSETIDYGILVYMSSVHDGQAVSVP